MLRAAFTNFGLQGLNLASKALLLFVLARYLSVNDMGMFGLLLATLGIAMYLVGLDFYQFNTRELLKADVCDRPRMIRDQFVMHAMAYLIMFPLLLMVFLWDILPWSMCLLFYGLLTADHIASEFCRILVTLSRPVKAVLQTFIRGGIWVYALTALWLMDSTRQNVQTVCGFWMLGTAVSICLSVWWLRDLPWLAVLRQPLNWRWMGRGLRTALPFLMATIALRGMMVFDIYTIEHFLGRESVGIYVVYVNIRNAVFSFVETGIVLILHPKIITAYQQDDRLACHALMRRFARLVIAVAVILTVVAAVMFKPVLVWIGAPLVYTENLGAFLLVMATTVVMAVRTTPHLALYACHRDRQIITAACVGLAIAAVANLLAVPAYGLVGAAGATLLAHVLLCIIMMVTLRSVRVGEPQP